MWPYVCRIQSAEIKTTPTISLSDKVSKTHSAYISYIIAGSHAKNFVSPTPQGDWTLLDPPYVPYEKMLHHFLRSRKSAPTRTDPSFEVHNHWNRIFSRTCLTKKKNIYKIFFFSRAFRLKCKYRIGFLVIFIRRVLLFWGFWVVTSVLLFMLFVRLSLFSWYQCFLGIPGQSL